jgi:hypothetical protein
MQSRIFYGGFMQNQLPVTHALVQIPFNKPVAVEWLKAGYSPIKTKVGAIPANFFFSL